MNNDCSIAIPTLNRAEVIKTLLSSILKQTVLPKQVIVVDDSKNKKTEDLVNQVKEDFQQKKIEIKYVRGNSQGLAEARNIGAAYSNSDIHVSVDDDVVLDKDYIKEILKIYAAYPNALGVGGYVTNRSYHPRARSNAINRLFLSYFTEPDKCRVLSPGISYPLPLTHVINSEWLSGTNSCYKRYVLNQFKWDEHLKKYSLCEDMDISYRIQKNHPNSLYLTPYARVEHRNPSQGRITSKTTVNMQISYHAYFFFKNMKQTPWNIANFVFGIFAGRFAISLFARNGKSCLFTIKAQFNLIRHLNEIRAGDFSSFEDKKSNIPRILA